MKLSKRILIFTTLAGCICAIVTWFMLAFTGVLDSGKFEVIQCQSISTNKIAMLARRSDNTALSGDSFFVVIGNHPYDAKELKKAFYSSLPVFVAGRDGLDLKVPATNVLTIECKDCGVTKELVERQRFSDHDIVIQYVGFP